MNIVSGNSQSLHPAVLTGLARYRRKVFVEKLGWELDCDGEVEFDQFDRDDTLYVVCSNEAEQVIGTALLLPTTSPYLLGEFFPDLPAEPDEKTVFVKLRQLRNSW